MSDNEIDKSEPASEQLDISGDTYPATPTGINGLARKIEQAENEKLESAEDEYLARAVSALKRIENAAEEARKEIYEPELDERVNEGERVLDLTKVRGSSTFVTDDAEAFDAVLDAGHDPREVASVKASKLKEVLGKDAEEYLGTSEYHYFRRQS